MHVFIAKTIDRYREWRTTTSIWSKNTPKDTPGENGSTTKAWQVLPEWSRSVTKLLQFWLASFTCFRTIFEYFDLQRTSRDYKTLKNQNVTFLWFWETSKDFFQWKRFRGNNLGDTWYWLKLCKTSVSRIARGICSGIFKTSPVLLCVCWWTWKTFAADLPERSEGLRMSVQVQTSLWRVNSQNVFTLTNSCAVSGVSPDKYRKPSFWLAQCWVEVYNRGVFPYHRGAARRRKPRPRTGFFLSMHGAAKILVHKAARLRPPISNFYQKLPFFLCLCFTYHCCKP